jgi:hypothetical protein
MPVNVFGASCYTKINAINTPVILFNSSNKYRAILFFSDEIGLLGVSQTSWYQIAFGGKRKIRLLLQQSSFTSKILINHCYVISHPGLPDSLFSNPKTQFG